MLRSTEGASVTVIVTSPSDGKELWRIALPASAGAPDSIAFGEKRGDARQIAVAWPEKNAPDVFHVGVWTLREGEPADRWSELISPADPKLGRHTKRIPSIAFASKNPWIATCGEDGKLTLWDLSKGQPRLIWEKADAHYPDVHGIAFNSDDSLLASGGGDYVAKVWRTKDMLGAAESTPPGEIKPLYTLSGHSDSVFAVAFSPDGHRIATGGYDRTIRIWDFDLLRKDGEGKPQPQTVATLSGHEGTVLALTFSDDGKLLLSGASDEAGRLWDAAVGRLLVKFSSDDGIVRSASLSSFDEGIHLGGEHGWRVWSARGGSLVHRLWAGGSTVAAIAFDSAGRNLAAAGSGDEGQVRIWDSSYDLERTLDPHSAGEYINGLAFSKDGRWLAGGGGNHTVHVWDCANDWKLVDPKGKKAMKHDGPIWGLCFDPSSRWLASSNESQEKPQNIRIKRWNVADWSLVDQSAGLKDQVYALAWDADGQRLVSGDSRANVTVLDAKGLGTKEKNNDVRHGELNVWSVAIMNKPHAVLSGCSDGHVYRWVPEYPEWKGPNKGEKISTSPEEAKVNPTINSVAYCAQTGWVAAGGVGPSVEIYDAKTLHRIRGLRGHDGTVWFVAFDPQGTRLAYGGLDGFVRVVDIDRMKHIDADPPEKLYEESKRATSLQIEDGKIVHTRL